MAYYIRLLTPSDRLIARAELSNCIKNASLTLDAGTDAAWEQLLLSHADGRDIAVIERNAVSSGSLAEEEIGEFVENLDGLEPRTGAEWLRTYLPTIKTVYAFHILGAPDDLGWSAIGEIKGKLWRSLGGILQADGEGFSNESGYHIVWEFSDNVSGPWWMGVLQGKEWVHFEMELSDLAQRAQFFRGELPTNVKLAS